MCEWVVSHVWMSQVPCVNESCHMCEWVMSHVWMSHVTCVNESCHMCEWVTKPRNLLAHNKPRDLHARLRYIRVYVYAYVYIYIYMYIHVYLVKYLLQASQPTRVDSYKNDWKKCYIYSYIHVWVYIYTYIYIYIYIYIYTYVHILIPCACTCIFIGFSKIQRATDWSNSTLKYWKAQRTKQKCSFTRFACRYSLASS